MCAAWFTTLIKEDLGSATQVAQAVVALREEGPALGRPLVDRLKGKGALRDKNIFAFDPSRSALLLLGGDKAGSWQRWYRENIPLAEQLYLDRHSDGREHRQGFLD